MCLAGDGHLLLYQVQVKAMSVSLSVFIFGRVH